ncbi:uncharacterized protein HD556DRAFT_1308326 [Suillus plorans]|uniref:Uncharacterized protein n=1 Tax=Suillus plorans TaxID=116603 RepID=A0A9P7APK2_9AGAM|nr:uncharacterized protein HD556DRAFT_1308326 [Suillus plorans]KAG1793850.1 hypothetical protein HD556DRAFT_1308326 [Suillus plorans]
MADDPIGLVKGFSGSAGTIVGCEFVEYINKGSQENPNQKTLLARSDRPADILYKQIGRLPPIYMIAKGLYYRTFHPRLDLHSTSSKMTIWQALVIQRLRLYLSNGLPSSLDAPFIGSAQSMTHGLVNATSLTGTSAWCDSPVLIATTLKEDSLQNDHVHPNSKSKLQEVVNSINICDFSVKYMNGIFKIFFQALAIRNYSLSSTDPELQEQAEDV